MTAPARLCIGCGRPLARSGRDCPYCDERQPLPRGLSAARWLVTLLALAGSVAAVALTGFRALGQQLANLLENPAATLLLALAWGVGLLPSRCPGEAPGLVRAHPWRRLLRQGLGGPLLAIAVALMALLVDFHSTAGRCALLALGLLWLLPPLYACGALVLLAGPLALLARLLATTFFV